MECKKGRDHVRTLAIDDLLLSMAFLLFGSYLDVLKKLNFQSGIKDGKITPENIEHIIKVVRGPKHHPVLSPALLQQALAIRHVGCFHTADFGLRLGL